MHIRFIITLQIVFISVLSSCKASKHIASVSSLAPVEEAYISTYKDISVNEMRRTGIPASITLAQGMIESDYGRSRLAVEANNHFGIKCHSDWSGPRVYHHDDRRNECFRKYGRPEDSFRDHSEFLRSGSRYRFLFDLDPTDYKGWAHGLKKAGYATNPDYANMLIRKIEEKNLYSYDSGYKSASNARNEKPAIKASAPVNDQDKSVVAVNPVNENNMVAARPLRVLENNKLKYIIVKDGDTREKIEEEFQLLGWELARYNDLDGDFTVTPGQMLYLQQKREKAESGKELHVTAEGDTMYLISQRYGIKLKSLYNMNRMEEDSVPQPGTKIWLRQIKPEGQKE